MQLHAAFRNDKMVIVLRCILDAGAAVLVVVLIKVCQQLINCEDE